MKNIPGKPIKRIFKAISYLALGGFTVLVIVGIVYLNNRPNLDIWHTIDLDAEFTEASEVQDFSGYLAREEKLFAQLDEKVLDKIAPEDRLRINRYHHGSLSDPARWPRNWNRTYELEPKEPQMGVLLLHGMSDSPYSLRTIGQRLHQAGARVIGLRSPGHGTAPSGLVTVKWEDMAAAMELALRHLHDQIPGKPIFIVGYSTGAALAVNYALKTLEETDLPPVAGLALISPSIGVTGAAALAVWQARIGHLLGLDKLAWNSIGPEYDPFKYNSFAVNAGDQVYRLTLEIQSRFNKLDKAGGLKKFPPVLAFQSIVDATVSTQAVTDGLFKRLPEGGHELVLFDINRRVEVKELLSRNPETLINPLLNGDSLTFALSLVTNRNAENPEVMIRHRPTGKSEVTEKAIAFAWPDGIYSLSHVALPFPESDPLYGGTMADSSPGISLGNFAPRGEKNVLQISANDMLRQRWNPFYVLLENRLVEFVGQRITTADR
jgi:alpha-beta hydrolase superfamily lysophospholipase